MNESRRKEKRIAKKWKMMRKKRMRWTERNVEKAMKTNKGGRWKMEKVVGWGLDL